MAAAWPPRAWLGLTAPRAGQLEVEHARTLSALPFTLLPSPSQPQQHTADAISPPNSLELTAAPQPSPSRPERCEHPPEPRRHSL